MGKRYVVTGGAGFIGTNLVERLCADGHHVVVVDDLSAEKRERAERGAEFTCTDVRDTPALIQAVRGADTIFHLAALPRVQYSIEHPAETFSVNVCGTLSVLEAARGAGVPRVVFASTSAVYGDSDSPALSESLPVLPKSPYALQKHICEGLMRMYAELYGLETVALRFFNVFGPHLDSDGPYALVVGQFLKCIAEGKPLTITGDGEQTRDFIHVEDVVEALVRSAEMAGIGGEVVNIGSGQGTTINALARMCGGNVQYVAPRIEPRHSCADIQRARELLHWTPHVSLSAGIGELKRSLLAN